MFYPLNVLSTRWFIKREDKVYIHTNITYDCVASWRIYLFTPNISVLSASARDFG